MPKEITIRKVFTRDELLQTRPGKPVPEYSAVIVGTYLINRLIAAGIPAIGYFGVLGIEWGKLTVTHSEGIDCDEWMYEWTGRPVPPGWPKVDAGGRHVQLYRIDKPLAQRIADEEEL